MARIDVPPTRGVTRAERFFLPPPHLRPDAWDLVPVAERAVLWFEQKAQRRLPRTDAFDLSVTLYARIDAGRWVASCPCKSAQIISPADPRMWCVECLSGWFQVIFPADVGAAERAVEQLPAHEQFWFHPDDDFSWSRLGPGAGLGKRPPIPPAQGGEEPGV
ncbi:hypothetical protein [Streptomyces sp. P17]|uniref:hypothetical protein n=1 Tax=Streptomyces sp. P17 TaxID=3074716 RepID=UPI0028F458C3|nr:hypothetical protein [Streptomyces sp. P17]MDT9695366.1 hypothetical protein [Streptomyces sp. P17]